MTPPLSKYQLEILNTEFYTNHMMFGRDKLFIFLGINIQIKQFHDGK
jgi:hypothetical protein